MRRIKEGREAIRRERYTQEHENKSKDSKQGTKRMRNNEDSKR